MPRQGPDGETVRLIGLVRGPYGERIELMAKVQTTCQIETYDEPAKPSIKIHSHWNRASMVVLEVGDQTVTVLAADLKRAIENCTNVGL